MKDVPLQINCFRVLGQNLRNNDVIAILDFEAGQLLMQFIRVVGQLQAEHRSTFMRLDAFHIHFL